MEKCDIETDNIITGKKDNSNSEKVCLDDVKVKSEGNNNFRKKFEYSVKCKGYIFKHYLMQLLYGRTGSLMINAKLVNMTSKKEIMLSITRKTSVQKFLACFISNKDLQN